MSFKDTVATDIDDVFFNTDEFAENAIIDGKTIPIITDDDALEGMSDVYAHGLSEGERFIFIREKDMHRLPNPGDQMTIDGKHWYVRHAVINMGVFALRIGRRQV